jgi:hypothetical protein
MNCSGDYSGKDDWFTIILWHFKDK